MRRSSLFVCAAILLSACAHASPAARVSKDASLEGAGGASRSLASLTSGSRFTVITFFSAHCPCQRAHDARLGALYDDYASRGVGIIAVDSEVSADEARDAAEARDRAYPFALLLDRGGALARAVGATYATYTLILDDRGVVVYRGGLDGDRTHLTADASLYVRDALDDLLGGRSPRVTTTEALGCNLQLR